MSEIAKNVFVTKTIITDLIKDPRTWLTNHDDMSVRYVGGIHNLSTSDKRKWASDNREPLRVIETDTGREEVWFPPGWKSPEYVSLDFDGKLTSHLKFERSQPTIIQYIQHTIAGDGLSMMVPFSLWYHGEHIHRIPNKHNLDAPAVLCSKMVSPVIDDEYIIAVAFNLFREFWKDGEWDHTDIGSMNIIFANSKLNTPEIGNKATTWITKHCRGGFFPFEDRLFGEDDEEFMFLADICSQG